MVFPANHWFQQDNNPKHASKYMYTEEFLCGNGINCLKSPVKSADLNRTESAKAIWSTT